MYFVSFCWNLSERNGIEVVLRVGRYSLRVVDEAGEDDDPEHQEEHEEHQLLGRGSECLEEDLEARGVSGEFEQSEDTNDGEKLQDVRILQVRSLVGQQQVDVETQCCDEINDVDWTLDELKNVWTGTESKHRTIWRTTFNRLKPFS